MNGRLIAAMIFAPAAAALAYAAMLRWQFHGLPIDIGHADLFFMPYVVSLIFEVFALLPLFLLLQRVRVRGAVPLVILGLALWMLCAFGLNWQMMPLREAAPSTLPWIVPGTALVSIFVLIWRDPQASRALS